MFLRSGSWPYQNKKDGVSTEHSARLVRTRSTPAYAIHLSNLPLTNHPFLEAFNGALFDPPRPPFPPYVALCIHISVIAGLS